MTASIGNCINPFLKGIYVVFSAVSCLFFMIGAIGYTHDKDTMKNIPWMILHFDNTDYNVYYSLKAQFIDFAGGNVGDFSTSSDTRYEKCDSDGHSAYVLVVIACLSSLACAFLSGALIKNDFSFGQYIGAGLAAVATFMSGIALALFMGDCKNALDKFTDNYPVDYEYRWGSASILTAVGMVLMFTVSLTMVLTARYCGRDAEPVPTSTQLENTV